MTGQNPAPRRLIRLRPTLVKLRLAQVSLALVALSGALAGCGGGSSDDQTTTAEKDPLQASLLTLEMLPSGSRPTEPIDANSPCGPLPIFRAGNAVSKRSPAFEVNGTVIQQAVGVFSAESRAIKAFESLTAPKRSSCILSMIRFRGPAKAFKARHLGLDDEAQLMRFKVTSKNAPSDYLDAVSIRAGRAVTALILLSPGRIPDQKLEQGLLREAAARLDEL